MGGWEIAWVSRIVVVWMGVSIGSCRAAVGKMEDTDHSSLPVPTLRADKDLSGSALLCPQIPSSPATCTVPPRI